MSGDVHDLDQTQLQMLRMVATGASGTAIAEQFGCSLIALAQQMVDIRVALGVDSTAKAVGAAQAADCL